MSSPLFDISLSLLFRTRLRRALQLIDHYGSAEEAWHHLDEPGMQETLLRAQQELDWIHAHDIRVWTLSDEDYPYRLRQCPDRPIVLYGKGNLHPSDGHIISVVGTRRCTERGRELTDALVRDLHQRLDQVTIVSGGAYGIDIAAHRAAIKYEVPTIIIPAHGLDRMYPYQHRPDAVQSLAKGGLLTEFPSGTEPLAPYFIQRNRIVAGLADAVVVVESRDRGGSLVTARMASDYDRELFAFPGRPQDETSRGCNQLIRTNRAHLINDVDELIEIMEWKANNSPAQPIQLQMVEMLSDLSQPQQQLVRILQDAEEGVHINLLVMETERPYGDVSSDLMELELQGIIRSLPGGIYRFVR